MAASYVPYVGPIVSRAEAKAAGSKKYFTGAPCKRGHISLRKTVDGQCVQCTRVSSMDDQQVAAKRRRSAEWDGAHREQKNARSRERQREKIAADPDGMRAIWRAEYARDRKASVSRSLRWQAANEAKVKAYYGANKEAIYQRARDWQVANPEKARAKAERWRLAHPEVAGRWRKANPLAAKAIKQNRRARERNAEGKHTAAEIEALHAKQGGRCVYCPAKLGKRFDADHIVPLSRGGSNWISNIQLLCDSCNSRKWATDPVEYARRIGLLI